MLRPSAAATATAVVPPCLDSSPSSPDDAAERGSRSAVRDPCTVARAARLSDPYARGTGLLLNASLNSAPLPAAVAMEEDAILAWTEGADGRRKHRPGGPWEPSDQTRAAQIEHGAQVSVSVVLVRQARARCSGSPATARLPAGRSGQKGPSPQERRRPAVQLRCSGGRTRPQSPRTLSPPLLPGFPRLP